MNSEKAKRRGTSHTTEIESSDTDLSFYAKKIKVYATARFGLLLPDYYELMINCIVDIKVD